MTVVTISIRPARNTTFSTGIVPYLHKEDKAIKGYIRSCAPCPAVWTLLDDPHALIDRQWQYFLIAINMAMTLENIYLILDDHLAFANDTGFGSLDNPGRADWFFNRMLTAKPPALNKVRTCSRNSLTGVEQYSLVMALKAVKNLLQGFLWSRRGSVAQVREAISAKVLNVKTFDSRFPPPLKAGKTYPLRIDDINPDDYQYNPRYNREMFMVADLVNKPGEVVQFPRGGLYSWTNDGTPYTFIPHISNPSFGPVLYTLDNLIKLPVDSDVPSVYRRN